MLRKSLIAKGKGQLILIVVQGADSARRSKLIFHNKAECNRVRAFKTKVSALGISNKVGTAAFEFENDGRKGMSRNQAKQEYNRMPGFADTPQVRH